MYRLLERYKKVKYTSNTPPFYYAYAFVLNRSYTGGLIQGVHNLSKAKFPDFSLIFP